MRERIQGKRVASSERENTGIESGKGRERG